MALAQAREKTLPIDHKVFLVPADPLYSPTEEDLWPVFTHTVHQCLTKFPEVSPRRQRRHRSTPRRAPRLAQPFPRQLRNALPTQSKKIKSRYKPGDLVQNNHFALGETRA